MNDRHEARWSPTRNAPGPPAFRGAEEKEFPILLTNLKAVADAFPTERFSVYVIFSKLAPFSAAEISRIRAVNDRYHRRAILLTPRELEPYHLYDRTAREFKIDRYAASFEDMAKVTEQVYYPQPGA